SGEAVRRSARGNPSSEAEYSMSDTSSYKPTPPAPGESSRPAGANGGSSRSHPALPAGDGQMTVISSRPPLPGVTVGRAAGLLESGGLVEGDRLGQFLLQKFVAGGGMGLVFRALDTTLNRE